MEGDHADRGQPGRRGTVVGQTPRGAALPGEQVTLQISSGTVPAPPPLPGASPTPSPSPPPPPGDGGDSGDGGDDGGGDNGDNGDGDGG